MTIPISASSPIFANQGARQTKTQKKNYLKRTVSLITKIPSKLWKVVKSALSFVAKAFRKTGEVLHIVKKKPSHSFLPGFPQSGNSCWTASLLSAIRAVPDFDLSDSVKHPLIKRELETDSDFNERKKFQKLLHKLLTTKQPHSSQVRKFQDMLNKQSHGQLVAGAQEDSDEGFRFILNLLGAKTYNFECRYTHEISDSAGIPARESRIVNEPCVILSIPEKDFQGPQELKLNDLFHMTTKLDTTATSQNEANRVLPMPEGGLTHEDLALLIDFDMEGKLANPDQIPKSLPIMIKRQKFDRETQIAEKDTTAIAIPEFLDIDISGHPDRKARFRLRSSVNHYSWENSAQSGHYMSYVRDPNNVWLQYNDSRVSKTGEKEMFEDMKHNCYSLFYDFVQIT